MTIPRATAKLWAALVHPLGGVDYGTNDDFLKGMVNPFDKDNEEFKAWLKDEDSIKRWLHYDVHNFSGRTELRLWAEKYPRKFLTWSNLYLESLKNNRAASFQLGSFTDAVFNVLLSIDPETACKLYEGNSTPVNVTTSYKVAAFTATLWNSKICNTEKHKLIRREALEEIRSEKELSDLVLCAMFGGTLDEMWDIAIEFCGKELARDRNLGVSLMAWFGDDASIARLEDLKANDASSWVRQHASWAYEVAQQEKSCKEVYRKTFAANSEDVSCLLQQLKPALTPMSRFWQEEIRRKADAEKVEPINNAIDVTFWYHHRSVMQNSTVVFGRKLEDFCRGEESEHFVTERIYPWWNLSV